MRALRQVQIGKAMVVLFAAVCFMWVSAANADIRVTYKSAKSTSSYYQMAVQIAEAMKT